MFVTLGQLKCDKINGRSRAHLRPDERHVHEYFVVRLRLLLDQAAFDVTKSGVVLGQKAVDEMDLTATQLLTESVNLEFDLKFINILINKI